MKTYKIFKAGAKIGTLEKTLNKLDEKGYAYVDVVIAKGVFKTCWFVIAIQK